MARKQTSAKARDSSVDEESTVGIQTRASSKASESQSEGESEASEEESESTATDRNVESTKGQAEDGLTAVDGRDVERQLRMQLLDEQARTARLGGLKRNVSEARKRRHACSGNEGCKTPKLQAPEVDSASDHDVPCSSAAVITRDRRRAKQRSAKRRRARSSSSSETLSSSSDSEYSKSSSSSTEEDSKPRKKKSKGKRRGIRQVRKLFKRSSGKVVFRHQSNRETHRFLSAVARALKKLRGHIRSSKLKGMVEGILAEAKERQEEVVVRDQQGDGAVQLLQTQRQLGSGSRAGFMAAVSMLQNQVDKENSNRVKQGATLYSNTRHSVQSRSGLRQPHSSPDPVGASPDKDHAHKDKSDAGRPRRTSVDGARRTAIGRQAAHNATPEQILKGLMPTHATSPHATSTPSANTNDPSLHPAPNGSLCTGGTKFLLSAA